MTDAQAARRLLDRFQDAKNAALAAGDHETAKALMVVPVKVWLETIAQDHPPEWARDPFNGGEACSCPRCGAWHEVVRPGKTQPTCDCEDWK